MRPGECEHPGGYGQSTLRHRANANTRGDTDNRRFRPHQGKEDGNPDRGFFFSIILLNDQFPLRFYVILTYFNDSMLVIYMLIFYVKIFEFIGSILRQSQNIIVNLFLSI